MRLHVIVSHWCHYMSTISYLIWFRTPMWPKPHVTVNPIWNILHALQGSGLFYFSDIKASTAKGVIPIELAKVEAARDKTEKKRFLIKVWVATAYTDVAKHRRYILSAQSSQVQVTHAGHDM